jgi:hypothetical protein
LTVASGAATPLDQRTAWASVATSLIVVGAGLRLLGLFSRGQLYIDDAHLALNIASRSLGDLTRPLDLGQAAPIPFLWLEKLMTQIGGVNEYALRALPLLASVAVLVLLWRVGRRAVGESAAVLATCLGAFSTFLISYANAVKQYSSDALVTLLVVWLVLDVWRAGHDRAAWRRLTVGGAAALWMSHPAVFVLAGATLALPARAGAHAGPTWWRRYALTITVWVSIFAAIYFPVYQAGEGNAFLNAVWDWTFLSPGAPDFGGRAWRAVRAMLVPPLWPGGTLLGTPLVLGGMTSLAFVAGLVAIYRSHGPSLVLLCAGPYIAVLGAAMIGRYPPADRFLLFAAPLLFFIYGSALWGAATAFPPPTRTPAVAAAMVLLTLWTYPTALEEGLHPQRRRETKALLRTVEARAPNAPVYLFTPRVSCVCSVWAFYTTDWNAPDTVRLRQFVGTWTGAVGTGSAAGGATPASAETISLEGRRHQELIGAGARIPYVPIARSPEPDPAWVDAESDRIRRAANPVAWLWVTELYPESTIAALLRGIRKRGGRLIFAGRVLGATAWEVEFPRAGGLRD